MEMQPNYYSIIPATVRYDKDLKANEKLLYGEITSLAQAKGCCWASNGYFAELYDVSKETVSRWISKLEKKGYVRTEVKYFENSKQIDKRFIYISDTPIDKIINTPQQNSQEGIDENVKSPIDKKVKDNNTSINNTSINNKENSRKSAKPKYDDTSEYTKLSKKLFNYLKQRNPEHKEPDYQKWADEFRKIVELDKRPLENVHQVLDWSQNNDFWQANIMSPRKLRQQYDTLKLQMVSPKKPIPYTRGKSHHKEIIPSWIPKREEQQVVNYDALQEDKTELNSEEEIRRRLNKLMGE